MTSEQMDLFVHVISSGMACGLDGQPIPCFLNYRRFIPQMQDGHTKLHEMLMELDEAMIAFYKRTASYEEDPIRNLDFKGWQEMVKKYEEEASG